MCLTNVKKKEADEEEIEEREKRNEKKEKKKEKKKRNTRKRIRHVIITEKSDLILTMRHSMIHRHTFVGLV